MDVDVDVDVDAVAIAAAVATLHDGGVVCFPTETTYGLAVNALDAAAVARLCERKLRPAGSPIALIAPDVDGALALFAPKVPERVLTLAHRYWPGPLTIVAAARAGLPEELVGDSGVGVRVSIHPVAAALVRAFGGPITATSANRSGEPAPTTAAAARAALGTAVDYYLDGGGTPGGPPSTIVLITPHDELQLLRAGAISIEP